MRRFVWWLTGIAAAVVVIATLLLVFRAPLLEHIAEAYLKGRGFPDASLSITDIGLGQAVLQNLTLGPRLPSVGRIEARYRISGLARFRVQAVRIDGVRAVVNTNDLTTFKSLGRLMPSGESDKTTAATGPVVEVSDARISIRRPGADDLQFEFSGRADLSREPARATLEGTLVGFPKSAPPAIERANLTVHSNGAAEGTARAPQIVLKASARSAQKSAETIVAAEIQWKSRENIALPVPLSANLQAQGISLSESHVDSMAWRGSGSVTAGAFELAGPMDARFLAVHLGPYEAKEITFTGTVGVSAKANAATAVTLADARVEMLSPPAFDAFSIRGPVHFTIPSASVERASDDSIRLKSRIFPERLEIELASSDGKSIGTAATANKIDVSLLLTDGISGSLRLHGGAVQVAEHNVAAEQIEATLSFPLQPNDDALALSGRIKSASRPAQFTPVALNAHVATTHELLQLSGAVSLPGHDASIPLRGEYRYPKGQGRIDFGPATLAFGKDGLQPEKFGAVLAPVSEAVGEFSVSGALTFKPDTPVIVSSKFDFRDLTIDTSFARIEGLTGKVELDNLFPPRTAGIQSLSARRAAAGVSLEDPTVRFRLQPLKHRPILVIENAQGRFADGLLYLDKTRIDLATTRNAMKIGVRKVSLKQLLHDWAKKGMAGTGTLSGRIPVVITPRGLVIDSGNIRAEGDGELKVNWGGTREALMRQSEQVALMAQTLEDFHYSNLRISIDRPADGALTLKVTMEGRNPKVKDGHPFKFNISLSGDLEKVFAAVRQGQRLGADLLRGRIGGDR